MCHMHHEKIKAPNYKLYFHCIAVWGCELSLAGASVWWGWGVQWSVSTVISSVSKVLASPTSTITLSHRDALLQWLLTLSTSWTSSSYSISSVTSPSSHVSPSSLLAEMITWSRRGCSVSITLTPSDASGSGCKEWQLGWGILCQGDHCVINCYKSCHYLYLFIFTGWSEEEDTIVLYIFSTQWGHNLVSTRHILQRSRTLMPTTREI